jgi:hypothetical protein
MTPAELIANAKAARVTQAAPTQNPATAVLNTAPADPGLDSEGKQIIVYSVFKNRIPSCTFVQKNGNVISFVEGTYRTTKQDEIDEITAEINAGHPHMYIDPNQKTIQSDQLDPLAGLRTRIIAEYLAAQAAATNPSNDRGSSEAEALRPAGTDVIQAAAAGSSSGA